MYPAKFRDTARRYTHLHARPENSENRDCFNTTKRKSNEGSEDAYAKRLKSRADDEDMMTDSP